MRFYGWKNTKTNCLLGATKGGEWVRVWAIRWLFLKLFGYYTATARGTGKPQHEPE